MRRVKAAPPSGAPVSRKYVTARDVYEFGPLLTWKDPEVRLLVVHMRLRST